MENVPHDVIDKIKKLLNHHAGCLKINSEQEAFSAMEMAKRLMRQHHLDMMSIANQVQDPEISECNVYDRSFFKEPLWLINLIKIVNNLCNCSCVLREDPKCSNGYIHMHVVFVALSSDIDRVYEMFMFFKKTIYTLANKHQKDVNGNTTHWRSFAEGFTTRLLERSRTFVNRPQQAPDDDIVDDVSWDDDCECVDEDDEEFSEWQGDHNSQDSNQDERSVQLYEYMEQVKKKLETYIQSKMNNVKDKDVVTKSRVVLSSYNIGRQEADKQNLRFTDKSHQLVDKTKGQKQNG